MDDYEDYPDGLNKSVDHNFTKDCSTCLNELCINEDDYHTYKSYVSVDTFEMVLIALNIIVFLAGIIGNALVFIAVTTTKSMQSVTNIFIVNLAMADMLVMLFCAPPSVIWDVTNTWVFGSLMCRIVIYIQDISVSVSVLTLTFIAYDRFNAICRPLQFSSRKTKAAVVIGGIWTVSGIIGIPDAVTLHLVTPLKGIPCREEDIFLDLAKCEPTWSENVDFFFILIKALLLYTLPLIFMSIAYYHIVKTLWRRNNLPGSQDASEQQKGVVGRTNLSTSSNNASSAKADSNNSTTSTKANGHGYASALLNRSATTCNSRSARFGRFVSNGSNNTSVDKTDSQVSTVATSNSANRNLDNQLRTRRKVAKMLIAVVIMFSINFFPVHFLPIVKFALRHTFEEGNPALEKSISVLQNAAIITHCMCYFNSAINPIIYYFMSAQFKAQYRRILSCRCTARSASPDYGRAGLAGVASSGRGGMSGQGGLLSVGGGGRSMNHRDSTSSFGQQQADRPHLRSRSCLHVVSTTGSTGSTSVSSRKAKKVDKPVAAVAPTISAATPLSGGSIKNGTLLKTDTPLKSNIHTTDAEEEEMEPFIKADPSMLTSDMPASSLHHSSTTTTTIT